MARSLLTEWLRAAVRTMALSWFLFRSLGYLRAMLANRVRLSTNSKSKPILETLTSSPESGLLTSSRLPDLLLRALGTLNTVA